MLLMLIAVAGMFTVWSAVACLLNAVSVDAPFGPDGQCVRMYMEKGVSISDLVAESEHYAVRAETWYMRMRVSYKIFIALLCVTIFLSATQ